MKDFIEFFVAWIILTFDLKMIYSKEHRKERRETLREMAIA